MGTLEHWPSHVWVSVNAFVFAPKHLQQIFHYLREYGNWVIHLQYMYCKIYFVAAFSFLQSPILDQTVPPSAKVAACNLVTPYPLNLPIRKPIYSTGAMARVWGGDGDMLQLAVPRCVHFNVFHTFAYTLSRSFECTNTFQKACQQDFLKNAIYTMHRSGMVNSTFQLESTSMDLWYIINMMYLQGVFEIPKGMCTWNN